MRTGDKRQAAILSVVAVFAVGFLIYQLVPKGSPANGAAANGSGSVASVTAEPQAASTPHLLATTTTPPPADLGEDVGESFGAPAHVAAKPTLPLPATFSVPSRPARNTVTPSPMPLMLEGTPLPAPSRSSEAGTAPPTVAPAVHSGAGPITVRLEATVSSGTPVAILRIGSSERTLRLGDVVSPGWFLHTVEEDAILVRSSRTSSLRRLPLGVETTL